MWQLDWKKIVCWLNDLILFDTCWVPLIGVIASMILGCSKLRKSIASAARQSRWSHAVGALWQLERQARSMLFLWKIRKQCWILKITDSKKSIQYQPGTNGELSRKWKWTAFFSLQHWVLVQPGCMFCLRDLGMLRNAWWPLERKSFWMCMFHGSKTLWAYWETLWENTGNGSYEASNGPRNVANSGQQLWTLSLG